ncbi:MAG: sporulation transcriptional regulator SpoIIID [Clostridia bacterium]|nr:sporulation transcriptional regulator SpoIIID [Clostridia bacterium]MBQ8584506.1 sporulation transcriptional regulator SpoIIID [Clostridia bacterium]
MIDLRLRERAELLAEYVIETQATVRACAKHFGISKSTVHKDLTYKLREISPSLWEQVREVLVHNKSERHLRGGAATKKKYLLEKIKKSEKRWQLK